MLIFRFNGGFALKMGEHTAICKRADVGYKMTLDGELFGNFESNVSKDFDAKATYYSVKEWLRRQNWMESA